MPALAHLAARQATLAVLPLASPAIAICTKGSTLSGNAQVKRAVVLVVVAAERKTNARKQSGIPPRILENPEKAGVHQEVP